MSRYDHWIEPSRANHWPTRVWCLALGEDGAIYYQIITSVVGAGDRVSGVDTLDREGFWIALTVALEKPGSIHIISHDTARIWDAVGLWERCEDGTARVSELTTHDQGELGWAALKIGKGKPAPEGGWSLGELRRRIGRAKGTVCLSDGAMIVQFQPTGCNGWATWIDLSNYGATVPYGPGPSEAIATWVSLWWLAWKGACRRHRLGSFGLTAASQADHGFRSNYYKGGIHITGGESADGLVAQGYYGGRAEAFRIGGIDGPCHYLDYNACYTSVMAETRVPITLEERYDPVMTTADMRRFDPAACIAEVTIHTPVPKYPKRKGTITLWPVGTFRTVLAGPELSRAASDGHIECIHRMHRYHCEPILSDFARELWSMRHSCKMHNESRLLPSVKLLANAFVGRLAQRRTVWTTVDMPDCDINWGEFTGVGDDGECVQYRSLGGLVQRRDDGGYAPDACPAIAAWITSEARMRLWDAMVAATREHVYYCDTDGIIVDEQGYENVCDAGLWGEGELGRISGRWTAENVCVYGIKHYVHDGQLVHAGIPVGATDRLLDGRLTYERDVTPKEQIKAGKRPTPERRRVTLSQGAVYQHGTVLPDGTVLPIRLGER